MSELYSTVRNSFAGKRVAIIGDLVADQFLSGTISRVSREAPVFILKHEITETLPGGAANAAANVASLGGVPCLIGTVGNDANGRELTDSLKDANVDTGSIVVSDGSRTTTKVRVLAGQSYSAKQQVIRIDYENERALDQQTRERLFTNVANAIESCDAVVFSDYGYGVIDAELYSTARELAARARVPAIVDSRFRLNELTGATAATPNLEEVERLIGPAFSDEDCVRLCSALGHTGMVITCGNQGMLLIEPGYELVRMPAIGSTVPVDVTGAGDTVIAAFALSLGAGLSFRDAATIANHAGGIVVMKKGTAIASLNELLASLTAQGNKAAATESLA